MVENNLLRIGQEAIVNAVKHAQATRIEVKIEFAERQTSLMVRDNGVGFDPAASAAGAGGFGLTCMRQRTAEMQGELQIQSESGSGSVIKLKVPDFSGKKSSNP
jgi:signal transduction histidine kinase